MLYTRLDFLSYEIRLLNIQEASSDESVHCTLEKTTLVNPGSYHALSYCWGDQRNKKEIIINDTTVEVGYNLEAASESYDRVDIFVFGSMHCVLIRVILKNEVFRFAT